MSFKTIIEPFKIKVVEPISISTEKEREEYLRKAHYNQFLLDADQVIIDFLTDSGTSAMSVNQWSGIMNGDEAYAGSKSWKRMQSTIRDLTGCTHVLPTHQGRAAERIIYGHLGGETKVFISNTHFDTTRANIEFSGATALDIPIQEALEPGIYHPFKGNMDTVKLEELINRYGPENIGAVILTLTNNSGGGQPASMANTEEVSKICKKYGVLFLLDCCRIAENAYFIKHREDGYENMSYKEIGQKLFEFADGGVMSAKKDALVNMGGFLVLRDDKLAEECRNLLIITEGYITYGGLSGRDMEAIAIGLKEVFDADYLHYRIKSTNYLGEKLRERGIPIIWPVGGHAVYVDAKAMLPHIPPQQYPGQALVTELYKVGGIRAVEIGSVMFGKYDENGDLIPAPMELVRLAIPRRVYTQSHIEYVIEVFEKVLADKDEIRGFDIIKEPEFLRHFTAWFKPVAVAELAEYNAKAG